MEIKLTLNSKGEELRDQLFRQQPDCCPECGFSHSTNMFSRNLDWMMACTNCGYVLQDKDYWFDEVNG